MNEEAAISEFPNAITHFLNYFNQFTTVTFRASLITNFK